MNYNDDLIRAEMGKQKLTQEGLADKAKLSRNTVASICNGDAEDVKLSTLVRIARALSLDLSDVVVSRPIRRRAA